MAKKIKIEAARLQKFEKKQAKRAQNTRYQRQYFLIVSEGTATEPNYFEAIRQKLPPHALENIVIEGVGMSTFRIVNEVMGLRDRAKRDRLRTYDQVWVVFDKDDFPAEHFNNAIQQAQANNIEAAWSNEAFELWYLLHLQNVETALSRTKYRAFIERELTKRMGEPFEYAKNRTDMYAILKEQGSPQKAMERAEKLRDNYLNRIDFANHNPCTTIGLLIKAIEKAFFTEGARAFL
jgi:RloB-like protein